MFKKDSTCFLCWYKWELVPETVELDLEKFSIEKLDLHMTTLQYQLVLVKNTLCICYNINLCSQPCKAPAFSLKLCKTRDFPSLRHFRYLSEGCSKGAAWGLCLHFLLCFCFFGNVCIWKISGTFSICVWRLQQGCGMRVMWTKPSLLLQMLVIRYCSPQPTNQWRWWWWGWVWWRCGWWWWWWWC